MKHIVKKGKKIIGFVYESNDTWFFAFGKPSQSEYISFACKNLDEGIELIKKYKS